jgi:hypothetical protein
MSLIERKENYGHFHLKLKFLAICKGGKQSPHCKAIVLSILEDKTTVSTDNGGKDRFILTLPEWVNLMYGVYSKQIIARSLTELAEENLIIRKSVVVRGSDTYEYALNFEKTNALINQIPQSFFEQYVPQSVLPTPSATYNTQYDIDAIPSDEWKSAGGQTEKVHRHNARAREQGLPATLTTQEWRKTINHFGSKCAICQSGNYQVLEHFIPLVLGQKGTTADNCIPTCSKCNKLKGDLHPLMLPEVLGLQTRMEEIQTYLATRNNLGGEVESE